MGLAARNAKKQKRAVTRGTPGTQKTTRPPSKGRGATPVPKKSTPKQAIRKAGRPRKSSAGAQATGARLDAVLSAQLEAISHELSSLTALRHEIQDLRGSIEALAERIDDLAESIRAGARADPDEGEPTQESDNPAHNGPPEGDTSDVEE
jgi:hypothetical protein